LLDGSFAALEDHFTDYSTVYLHEKPIT